jgi:histidinol-phosphate/aromatic aminotransferase/cobyric acid decarboxylase-like protein/SAM-dependent methyltransferase
LTEPAPDRPWYERYFTADYWTYATAEYSAARTGVELGYLAGVLTEHAPGGRVLDLGCGLGRHAVGLAARGFRVTGVDVSGWALDRAAERAAAAGVDVTWLRRDLLAGPDLPECDAVVCVQAFGWGSDADQLRMLRAARRALRPGGVLVLDHSNVSAILRIYAEESHAEVDGTVFDFRRRYDAVTGRSGGAVRVRRPDGSTAELPDDVRLYQPPEVADLLRRAGFAVHRVDAEFVPGGPVRMDSRYVQFVATAPADRVSALDGHRAAAVTGLDLRWAVDEVEFVRPVIAAAWAGVTELPERARRYDLADPYAAARLRDVVAGHFGCPATDVLAGAGTTGLLRALAGLAAGGLVLAEPAGHPELPLAAGALGIEVVCAAVSAAAVRRLRPAVTVLDRPGVLGRVRSAAALGELAAAVAETGGVLVLDETCAAYLAPADSAVRLGLPRTVVLRGLSKGYGCGGLRVGFAVPAPEIAGLVRDVVAPLAVSAVSLDVACALLRAGDVLAPLRAAIAAAKPEFRAALGERAVLDTDPRVPWVLVRESLADNGIVAKSVSPGLWRLSVPLSADRRAAARAALGAP